MRINSEESIKAAAEVHNKYGSWSAAVEVAEYVDGVYCLPPSVPTTQQSAPQPTASGD